MHAKGRGWQIAAAGVAALLCVACGEDETAPQATGPAMGEVNPHALAAQANNRPPQIERLRLDPRSPRTGGTLRADVRVVDPDGDPAWAEFEWFADGERLARGEKGELPLDRIAKGTRIEVRVVPNDGRLQGDWRSARARVENSPPEVSVLELDHELPIQRGQVIGVVAEASDADLEDRETLRLRYEWFVNDRSVGATEKSLDTGRLRRGDTVFVRVTPRDGDGSGVPRDSLAFSLGNISPRIVSTPEGLGSDGSFHYKLEAEDADGDRSFTWELVKAPEGMTLDASLGELRWIPGLDQAGEHEVEIHVIDAHGGRGGQAFPISVKKIEPETPVGTLPASPRRY